MLQPHTPPNTAIREKDLPRELDLLPLLQDSPRLRADLLFFIRLAGTYYQSIFWQAFPKTAVKRRKILSIIAEKIIKGKEFRDAILDPQKRRAQSTDMLHSGFVELLQYCNGQILPEELQTEIAAFQKSIAQAGAPSIKDNFSRGLKARHGLPWAMKDFAAAIEILQKQRHFLEHFSERLQKYNKGTPGKISTKRENAELMRVLGLLLLPQFCNEAENTIRRVKNPDSVKIANDVKNIYSFYKTERKRGIKTMFAEARTRKNMYKEQSKTKNGKYKNKIQKSRELLNEKWRKYYFGLKLAKTDFRENTFKIHYDFIGRQNFRQIYRILGAELDSKKLKKFDADNPQKTDYAVYTNDEKRPSFRNEIVPFYIMVMRIQKSMHFYLEYAPIKNRKREYGKKYKIQF